MKDQQIFGALAPVVRQLDAQQISYCIGGSVASCLHGFVRTTMDADLLVDLRHDHVDAFVKALDTDYYVSAPMIVDAVSRRRSFNIMLYETMFKVDFFIAKARAFDQSALSRAQCKLISGATSTIEVRVASPEDLVLLKLEWYRKSNDTSERQWRDVQEVLKVSRDGLDIPYLRHWASELNLSELLEEALADAGAC
ncbi:MAG: hypothetical protein R3C19_17165 [Planctomycetaceae bacterium]